MATSPPPSEAKPRVSVVIPVRNGEAEFAKCLAALGASTTRDVDVVVVDDGSSDNSAGLAREWGARVLVQAPSRGAAAARNRGGAEARGDILLFIDADVLVEPTTIAEITALFEREDVGAVIGSYAPVTPAPGFFSKFKNIHHHYIHQISREDAATFWTGCGAVRREAFRAAGGFDEDVYGGATIEDIEFGYRLHRAGYGIRLAKDIQVRHLKRYNLWSLMKSDIFNRAIPWTKLMMFRRHFRSDLNTTPSNAVSVLLAGAIVGCLLAAPFRLWALAGVPIFFALFKLNTMPFNRYVKKHFGWGFTVASVLMSVWYFFYAGIGLVLGVAAALGEAAFGSAGRRAAPKAAR